MPLLKKFLNKKKQPAEMMYCLSRWVLRSVVVLVPIIFLTATNDVLELNKYIIMSWLVAIGVAMWLIGVVLDKSWRWKKPLLIWPVVIWVAVVGLSTLFSVDRWASLWGSTGYYHHSFLATLVWAIFFIWFIQLVDKKFLKQLLWWFLSGTALLVVFNFLQVSGIYLFSSDFTQASSFNAVSGSPSLFAAFLAVVVLIAIAMSIKADSKFERLMGAALAVGIFALLVVYDRSVGWYTLMAGSLILLVFQYRLPKNNARLSFGLIGILALALIFLLLPINTDIVADISLNNSVSWSIARDTIADHAVLGSGPNTYLIDFANNRPLVLNQSILWGTRFVKAGSDFWQIMTTMGILGIIAWSLLILAAIRLIWQRLFRAQPDKLTIGLAAAWLAVLVSILLFPSSFINWFMFWFLLASLLVVMSEESEKKNRRSKQNVFAPTLLALVIIGGILLMVLTGKFWLAEWNLTKARIAIANIDNLDKVEELITNSINNNQHQAANQFALANNNLIKAQLALINDDQEEEEIIRLVQQAIVIGEGVLSESPHNPENVESLIGLYQTANQITGEATGPAVLELQQSLIDLEPNHPRHYANLGLSFLGRATAIGSAETENSTEAEQAIQTDLNSALDSFSKAVELKANYSTAILGLVRTNQLLGNEDETLALADRAALILVDDAAALYTLGTIYEAMGENDNAELAYLAAAELAPADIILMTTLGSFYKDNNNTEKARTYLEKALAITPDDPTAKALLDELDLNSEAE